jgi:hypothetical protein
MPRRARVGIANAEAELVRLDVFLPELERLGWRPGANLEILQAGAGGDPAQVPSLIAALVARETPPRQLGRRGGRGGEGTRTRRTPAHENGG